MPRPLANTVSYRSDAPAPVGDWGITEDVFDEDDDYQVEETGSETSILGAAEGTLSGTEG